MKGKQERYLGKGDRQREEKGRESTWGCTREEGQGRHIKRGKGERWEMENEALVECVHVKQVEIREVKFFVSNRGIY